MNDMRSGPILVQKRPAIVEAFQFDGEADCAQAILLWAQEHAGGADIRIGRDEDGRATLTIETLEGPLTASPGDWIIRGVKGEFYPCKPDVFNVSYQPLLVHP